MEQIKTYSNLFKPQGWMVHSWEYGGLDVTVLQREPFRLEWAATQLVTYVYLIQRRPENYQSLLDDFAALRKFAGKHKQTWLPFGFQCGYALLPIYMSDGFSEELIKDVQKTYKKRWCVFHAPALFDLKANQLYALDKNAIWGLLYMKYLRDTVSEVSETLIEMPRRVS